MYVERRSAIIADVHHPIRHVFTIPLLLAEPMPVRPYFNINDRSDPIHLCSVWTVTTTDRAYPGLLQIRRWPHFA